MRRAIIALALATGAVPCSAAAQEVFAGLYLHGIDTPMSLQTNENGANFVFGYRFAPLSSLSAIGRPTPYVIGSINTEGDTSFVGGGVGWTIGKGRIYVRPAIGVVMHDGPSERVVSGQHTELGSRILFEPEISVGYRFTDKLTLEVSWIHLSQGQLFNARQNPGLDMTGARLSFRL